MSENAELNELIKDIRKGLKDSSGFASKHLPDMAKEALAEGYVEAKLELMSGAFFAVLSVALIFGFTSIESGTNRDLAIGLTAALGGLITVMSTYSGLHQLLLLNAAPKLHVARSLKKAIK